ncbi:MAG: hypothetical protein ACXVY3_08830 [Gaiellaceae bacterium]
MLRWRNRLTAVLIVVGCAGLSVAAAQAAAPVNSTPPTVAGDPTPGSTVTCDPGTWEDVIDGSEPLVAWVVNGVQATGFAVADQLPLTLAEGDLGKRIACAVQASNIDGTSTVLSAEVVVVRCTAATVSELSTDLQTAQSDRATAAKRLKATQAGYRKLVAEQAKQQRRYFAKVKSPARRRAFLSGQKSAREKAKRTLASARDALDAADLAVAHAQQKLAVCSAS